MEESKEKIAIIGMSGRFPKCKNIEEFWQRISKKEEMITHFSSEELRDSGVESHDIEQNNYIRAKGYLEDTDLFDADFFNFTSSEAIYLDPQQRFLLECAWEALENSGYSSSLHNYAIGTYLSGSLSSYLIKYLLSSGNISDLNNFQKVLGNDKDFLATRVAYKLDLHGPAMTIQTACSSSLVAVHEACFSLLSYQCDMAIAGGASITFPAKEGYFYYSEGINSPDGKCRPFDSKAQGTVPGNGVGVIVLKRLSDAIKDKDHIYATIIGTAINNDGADKVGFTAPSVNTQAEVIIAAIQNAEIDPSTISYIETHGTATPIGDPIEVAALNQAFHSFSTKPKKCALGSIKSQTGHLDAAAGIAGVIKAALAIYNNQIPPTANFQEPNPKLQLSSTPFYVNSELKNWDFVTKKRAGVSSFGIGGTNAHIILEEPPKVLAENISSNFSELICLSAKTNSALENLQKAFIEKLKSSPLLQLRDVSATLCLGRREMDYRCAYVADSKDNLLKQLEQRKEISQKIPSVSQDIYFVFDGSLSSMDAWNKLYHSCSDFQTTLHDLISKQNVLKKELILNFANTTEELILRNMLLYYAYGRLLINWGVSAQKFVGAGFGLMISALLAETITLEDAMNFYKNPIKLPLSKVENTVVELSTGQIFDSSNHSTDEQKRLFNQQNATWNSAIWKQDNALIVHFTGQDSQKRENCVAASIKENAVLETLKALWQYGVKVDWLSYFNKKSFKRVSLPTYQFQRKKYFAEISKTQNSQTSSIATLEESLFEPSWERRTFQSTKTEYNDSPIVVWNEKTDFSSGLIEVLQNNNHNLFVIEKGEKYCIQDKIFTLNTSREEDFKELVRELPAGPIRLLVSTILTDSEKSRVSEDQLIYSLYESLVKFFKYAGSKIAIEVTFITNQAYAVMESHSQNPWQLLAASLAKTAIYEYANLTFNHFDIDDEMSVNTLYGYLKNKTAEPIVALRKGYLWLPSYQQLSITENSQTRLQHNQTYLITGGLGGMGFELTKHLLKKYRSKVVLVNRKSFPRKEEWSAWKQTHGVQDPITQKIVALESALQVGGDIIIVNGDISNLKEIREQFQQGIPEIYKKIRGIFHLAGDSTGELLKHKSEKATKAVFSAKTFGTINLLKLFDINNLDFLVMASSLRSIVGGVGQSDYTAANAFLDAFSWAHRGSSCQVVSINWNSWKEIGMATADQNQIGWLKDFGDRKRAEGVTTQEGLEIFEKALRCKFLSQVIVCRKKIHEEIEEQKTLSKQYLKMMEQLSSNNDDDTQTETNELSRIIEIKLMNFWQEMLGLESVDVNMDFFEMGGHSLFAVQLLGLVRTEFQVDISMEELFSKTTIRKMARFLEEKMLAKLEELSDEEVEKLLKL